MINNNKILILILLSALLFSFEAFSQGIIKNINVGYIHWRVADSGDEGEGSMGWGNGAFSFQDGFIEALFASKAVMMGCKNWTDTTGQIHSVKISGHGQWEVDDRHVIMPVPDKDGFTIHRYYRYQPPPVTVDGLRVEDPFPLNFSDHLDPEAIPGNADAMTQSYVNSDMGVSVRIRTFAFSQQHHDKYLIREYTFINTGNVDLDDEIELPDQTIEDFYFLKQLRPREWDSRPWMSAYGEYPNQEPKVLFGYPQREEGSEYDALGDPYIDEAGQLTNTGYQGETTIFASKSPSEFNVNDENQPHMYAYLDVDFDGFTFQSNNMTETQKQKLYQVMQEGATNLPGINWPEMTGTRPGTHYGVRLDERGFAYISEMEAFGYSSSAAYSIGPYTLAHGDSIKIVMADVWGSIGPEVAYEVGKTWLDGEIAPNAPDYLPPQYEAHPELLEGQRTVEVNEAKDEWVFSGRDSLFQTARAAKWAYDHNLEIPVAPPAPSLTVTSLPEYIRVEWGNESETASDFAGYKVYRALGSWYPHVPEEESQLIGSWELVFECGEGTSTALTHEYFDKTARRGVSYFYAVTAFDDGQSNGPDFDGNTYRLESNKLSNITTKAAFLLKPGGTLEDVVVVPNPFNLAASQIQYPGEPNKILFLNVPSKCTIRIFTESGDLVKVIDHEGSGDASWGNIPEEHSATETGQIVVSGIYIAFIETPDGKSTIRKFIIVR